MTSNRKLMIMPGDGIGPEVMKETLRLIDWLAKNKTLNFDIIERDVGGKSYDLHGTPLTDEALNDSLKCDAILFGAVGGPKYDDLSFELKPERGLLTLRKELDLFANLRPAIVFPPLVDSSTLKPDVVRGLDIMILRELTGGVYFAEPRGIDVLPDGNKKGYDTNLYTTPEIQRIGRVAFDLAKKRDSKVTSVEKSNVMLSGVLWKEVMTELHINEGQGIDLQHMFADNCAMQLVRAPKQFDVIVCDNLFGDMLSDSAAMLTGSLGMLPSASLGAPNKDGIRKAMYEPVHGSAPDITGKGVANPLAQVLSFTMMLRYSFDHSEEADLIESAVSDALSSGARTPDLGGGSKKVSTTEMMDLVINSMNQRIDS